jgi:DNA adenine methylase
MRYFGGKARTAERLASLMPPARAVWEPFCGGMNMTLELVQRYDRVIATDVHPGPIALGKGLQAGWHPPRAVSREQYKRIQLLQDDDPLKSFAGFGCSYSGKWFAGYDGPRLREYQKNGMEKAVLYQDPCRATAQFCERLRPWLDDVEFHQVSFFDVELETANGLVIYADPPFEGLSGYDMEFCNLSFWQRCQAWVRCGARVFVSESKPPPCRHKIIWSDERRNFRSGMRAEYLAEVMPVENYRSRAVRHHVSSSPRSRERIRANRLVAAGL